MWVMRNLFWQVHLHRGCSRRWLQPRTLETPLVCLEVSSSGVPAYALPPWWLLSRPSASSSAVARSRPANFRMYHSGSMLPTTQPARRGARSEAVKGSGGMHACMRAGETTALCRAPSLRLPLNLSFPSTWTEAR